MASNRPRRAGRKNPNYAVLNARGLQQGSDDSFEEGQICDTPSHPGLAADEGSMAQSSPLPSNYGLGNEDLDEASTLLDYVDDITEGGETDIHEDGGGGEPEPSEDQGEGSDIAREEVWLEKQRLLVKNREKREMLIKRLERQKFLAQEKLEEEQHKELMETMEREIKEINQERLVKQSKTYNFTYKHAERENHDKHDKVKVP